MKFKFVVVLWLLAVPAIGLSQSTLNFPKLFSPAELASTGFAIVNPGAASATVTFTLYGAGGQVLSTTQQTIAAGGQFAKTGDQVVTSLASGGWVQATSGTSGIL